MKVVLWLPGLCALAVGLPAAAQVQPPPGAPGASATDPHAAVLAESLYPSAAQCATCHAAQYEEWRFSSHAYASISPMFHKFEQRINDLSQGTVGYFCMRCHGGVGTSLGERRDLPLWQRSRVSREGVTCVTCHRVDEAYNKVNGERRIIPGDIQQPVYGNLGGDGVRTVVENREAYNVAVSPDQLGLKMHRAGIRFAPIAQSEFCVSCHQVAVHPGIKLETVWDEYRASPALAQGTTCQDCHMSTRPGRTSGYATGPAAVVNGRSVRDDRRRANHSFVGPGYPITHPGIFPHHPEAGRFSDQVWLSFDYRAGWGTDAFEAKVADGSVKVDFPPAWASADDRVEARLIVADNLKKLEEKRALRRELMEGSSRVEGPYFARPPQAGQPLRFHYKVTNANPGHNLPSGSLGAQPEVWLNVALIDPDGKNVWESGYVDGNGDMADLHSFDVAAGTLPHDAQLFNLQSKFLTTNVKGTDREMYLPVPFDPDQIPFIRPAGTPNSVLNHPPFIRMEKRSLPPLGSREASYTVPAAKLARPGTYRLAVRLRSRAEPIYFMRFVGATPDMEQAMNEWMLDIHAYTVKFDVQPSELAPGVELVEHDPKVFSPDPAYADKPYDARSQEAIYGAKHLNKTARPWIEWGRRLYDRGAYPPSPTWFGEKNPAAPSLLVYGDWRVAAALNDDGGALPNSVNGTTRQSTVATRLNLDFDLRLTSTERLHAFVRPFDRNGSFLRYDLDGKHTGFVRRFDFNLETLYFEGDWGPLAQGWTGRENRLDLPFTLGLVPLFTQNGIWLDDAFLGAALAIPAFNSRTLDVSNADLTLFTAFDKVTSPAFPDEKTHVYGLAGIVDANRGYWEFGYGYLDADRKGLSYHNATIAFTHRYRALLSGSVRLITNLGQSPPAGQPKTADGTLLLIESSLITRKPYTLLPYCNLFAGFDRPQALARAAGNGGVLKNTGINFESDGLTGFPTLDDSARDSWGGAFGVEYLFNLDRQLVFEVAAVRRTKERGFAVGDQAALGVRFQNPLNNAWILRLDAMYGIRDDGRDAFGARVPAKDVYGARLELRRKI